MTNLASDTFTGTNGAAWSSTWATGTTSTGSSATIQTNRGRMTTGSAGGYSGGQSNRVNITPPVDAVVLFKFRYIEDHESYPRFWIRSNSTAFNEFNSSLSGYYVDISRPANEFSIGRATTGTDTKLATGGTSTFWVTGQDYWCRFGVVGNLVRARWWTDGGAEPGTWMLSVTDSTFTTAGSGGCGFTLRPGNLGSRNWYVDDFSLDTTWPGTAYDLDSTNTLTWSQSAAAAMHTHPDASQTLTWTQIATAASARILAGSNALTWTQSGTIVNSRVIAGTNALTWTQTSDMKLDRIMAATNTLTFTQSAILDVQHGSSYGLDALNDLTWTQAGNIVTARVLAASNAMVLTQEGSLALSRILDGTNALVFTQSAAASLGAGADALNGLIWTQVGALKLARLADSVNGLVFSQTAGLLSTTRVVATQAILFAQHAELTVQSSGLSGGGWGTLINIIALNRQWAQEEQDRVPLACPNDGEPLTTGPNGELRCRFDGWVWNGQPVRY